MSRFNGVELAAKALPDAEYDLAQTLDAVRFLMHQMKGLDNAPMQLVKIPAGGGTSFTIPNGTDEPEAATSITGLIVAHHATNAYWQRPYDDSPGEVPVCSSMDGVFGVDSDGIELMCRVCANNRMGSGHKGRGKACKNMARLLILREGSALPIELALATMSLPNWAAYMATLASMRLTPLDVITKIKLQQATNSSGKVYSRAIFTAVGTINRDTASELRQTMAAILAPVDVTKLLDEASQSPQSA
ncbi:hypothetical protein AGMMS49992_25920 [Clostridia bacterium]|nr:hypothetical protein AGMMS49992_25920 [Clostridia bacterium]